MRFSSIAMLVGPAAAAKIMEYDPSFVQMEMGGRVGSSLGDPIGGATSPATASTAAAHQAAPTFQSFCIKSLLSGEVIFANSEILETTTILDIKKQIAETKFNPLLPLPEYTEHLQLLNDEGAVLEDSAVLHPGANDLSLVISIDESDEGFIKYVQDAFTDAGGPGHKDGHEAVVQLLLGDESTKNKINVGGANRALFMAAENGHEAVVKLLLGDESTKNKINAGGANTALKYAAANGHEAVVQLLLTDTSTQKKLDAWFVNPALFMAAENGYEAVVKLLLSDESTKNKINARGVFFAFDYAAANGQEAVVKLLLTHASTKNIIVADHVNHAFDYAAENGHEAVVKLLHQLQKIDESSRFA